MMIMMMISLSLSLRGGVTEHTTSVPLGTLDAAILNSPGKKTKTTTKMNITKKASSGKISRLKAAAKGVASPALIGSRASSSAVSATTAASSVGAATAGTGTGTGTEAAGGARRLARPTIARRGSITRREVRSPDGRLVVSQTEMVVRVFQKIYELKSVDDVLLAAILTEYMRCIQYYGIPPNASVFQLLAETLVRSGAEQQLYQLLQYHIPADSAPLAQWLLDLGVACPRARQIALDMMRRMEEPKRVLEALLDAGDLYSAMQLARATKLRLASKSQVSLFIYFRAIV